MKLRIWYFAILVLASILLVRSLAVASAPDAVNALRCVAFSPYVSGYNPNTGPHPPPELIDTLLEGMVQRLGFRCILTYGMLNGLDHTFAAAQTLGVKVIAIIWLDSDPAVNTASIAAGIAAAQQYPETIVRLSCGSEVRTRLGAAAAEPIIRDCITRVRDTGVTQPLTSIDTWWSWCNETWPCQPWSLAQEVDWIGVNIYPWWENKYSALFTCIPADQADEFHLTRLQDLRTVYPTLPLVMTEFGWPAGPEGYRESNIHTGEQCGEASQSNQRVVIEETLRRLENDGQDGILFEAFRESWKSLYEGVVGAYWGVCQGEEPYTCIVPYGFLNKLYLPVLLR